MVCKQSNMADLIPKTQTPCPWEWTSGPILNRDQRVCVRPYQILIHIHVLWLDQAQLGSGLPHYTDSPACANRTQNESFKIHNTGMFPSCCSSLFWPLEGSILSSAAQSKGFCPAAADLNRSPTSPTWCRHSPPESIVSCPTMTF